MSLKNKVTNKKFLIPLALVLILLIGTVLLIKSLNSPAEGVVNINADTQLNTPPAAPKQAKGKFVTFNYPYRFEESAKTSTSASLEHWILYARQALGTGPSAQFAINVSKLSAGGAKEDSAYKLFEAFPNKYKISKETYQGEEVLIGTNILDEYARTALWGHKDKLLAVSVTSSQANDQLVAEMTSILKSVKWL